MNKTGTVQEKVNKIELLNPKEFAPELEGQIHMLNQKLKQVAQSYEDIKNRLEVIESTSDIGFWELDYDEGGRMTRINWNGAVQTLSDYEDKKEFPKEVQTWLDNLLPESCQNALAFFENVTRVDNAQVMQNNKYVMETKDGGVQHFQTAGKVICREDGTVEKYLGSYRNITTEMEVQQYIKKIEEMNKELEERLEMAETIGGIFNICVYMNLEDHSYKVLICEESLKLDAFALNGDVFHDICEIFSHTVCDAHLDLAKKFVEHDSLQKRLEESQEENHMTTLEVYSDVAERWFRLCFIGGDRDEEGNFLHAIFGASDITEDKINEIENLVQQQQLMIENSTDAMTGLLNKKKFIMDAKLQSASELSMPYAFIFMDLDHFKDINDKLGHAVGDQAIKDAAKQIRDVFRQCDLIGRFGGDEFVMFVKNMPEHILMAKLSDLLEKLRLTYTEDDISVSISSSMGVVFCRKEPVKDFNELMTLADEQLYKSKEDGRNRYTLMKL